MYPLIVQFCPFRNPKNFDKKYLQCFILVPFIPRSQQQKQQTATCMATWHLKTYIHTLLILGCSIKVLPKSLLELFIIKDPLYIQQYTEERCYYIEEKKIVHKQKQKENYRGKYSNKHKDEQTSSQKNTQTDTQ